MFWLNKSDLTVGNVEIKTEIIIKYFDAIRLILHMYFNKHRFRKDILFMIIYR